MLSLTITMLWLVEGAMALENMTVGHSLPYRQIGEEGQGIRGKVCHKYYGERVSLR